MPWNALRKATAPMASAPRLPPPVVEPDLDEQIALAEQAVIARDARIRRRAGALVVRVKNAAVERAGGGWLLGMGAVARAWWLKRPNRPNSAPPAAAAMPESEAPSTLEHLFRDAGLTLAGLLPVLWPMLPRAWRRLLTPG